jgi:uracil-DNA glycosylase
MANNWKSILAPVLESAKITELKAFLKKERETKKIYPEGKDIFRAFDLCPYENTKVVIIGQGPYHTPGTADGIAFSTKQDKRPPSLEVIFKEIYKDLNIQYFQDITFEEFFPSNNLEKWTQMGFLLLNSALTVEEGKPDSHLDIGWQNVIKTAIEGLNAKEHQVIILLWGKEAKQFEQYVDPKSKNVVFTASHPAAELYKEGAGFYGCRHFSLIRDILPQINGINIFPTVNLDCCFDKEKAKELIKSFYPMESEKICQYIDKELIIHVPFNKDKYWEEVRKFEKNISTIYPKPV